MLEDRSAVRLHFPTPRSVIQGAGPSCSLCHLTEGLDKSSRGTGVGPACGESVHSKCRLCSGLFDEFSAQVFTLD